MERLLLTTIRTLALAAPLLSAQESVGAAPGPEAALEAYVAAQFRADGPGGVVLVARGSAPILRAAYGLADVEGALPMRIDQSLPIGSLTKSFTAAAILRLAERGELGLADDVREHVPDAPVGEHTVTLEELLTHTSGMPNLVDVPGFFGWAREKRSTAQLLGQTVGVPFLFEPGAGFAYSDSGYILLGAVLESRGEGSWADVVREVVAEPLGLGSVGAAQDLGVASAVGYEVQGDSFARAEGIDWSVPHASGALVATVDDLLSWVRAWGSGAIAPAELAAGAWSGRVLPDGTLSGYGYGWKRCAFEDRVAIQHGGWVPGFTASLLHLPAEELTAIALTNADGGVEATYLTRRCLRFLLTGSPDITPCALSDEQRAAVAGVYRTERGSLWRVASAESGFSIDLGDGPIELVALSPRVLAAADSDGCWCFTFEPAEGRATSASMSLTCEPQARARRVE